MAEDQAPAGTIPAAGGAQKAVPQPAPPVSPATGQEQPADGGNPRARAAALRAEAAAIEAALEGPETVSVRVGPPHCEMRFGGFTLTADYPTPVPVKRLPDLRQAAGSAGVNLITEG